ncbi:MAG: acetyl-CoA hydrolase/transferase C-terminal domain-containing protein [Candidatus Dormibacteria bacterium]
MVVLDLREFIRPGDTVLWGQGTGEPRSLTEALVAQRASLGGTRVFLGAAFSDTIRVEYADHLRFTGIGGMGTNAALTRAGVLDVLPCHISAIPGLIESGRIPVDVVLAQVSPAGPDGRHSLGLVGDYLPAAIARARVVIAEVNDQVPRTLGEGLFHPEKFTHLVYTSRPPVMVESRQPGPVEEQIAALVGDLVPDGAVLQLGIGNVFRAIGTRLASKRNLGIHSGVVGDWLVDLVRSGAVTNAQKAIDQGVSVTGALFGTRTLYDFAHENPAIHLRPISYTHDTAVLGRLDRLVAINSAVEVDVTGQVNAETLMGSHIGAVGGQVDFMRAALASSTGRSIIALPSTARRGEVSRIVPKLADAVVTTPRSDADMVVTEFGVADLKGMPLRERARRLIGIADPRFRVELEAVVASWPNIC